MFSKSVQLKSCSKAALIVIGTALSLRLALVAYALLHFGSAWFFSRGSEMGLLASSLVHGQGLSSPFGPPTGPTAIVAPGYPILVSILFWAFGSYTDASALGLMLLHVGCNTATVWLIYRFSRQIASEGASLMAALFWACSPPLLWMPTIFWETSLSCMLLVGVVSSMMSLRTNHPASFWFVCGGFCAASGLFNPALLPSLTAVAGYTLFRTTLPASRWQSFAACLAGLALVFSPWPIRNARVLHTCVLTRTTVGLELWMGNHPGATGFLEPSIFPTYNKTELADYQRRGEIGYTTHKGQLARIFIQTHPAAFTLLSSRRFIRFWTGSGSHLGSALFSLHAMLSFLLGCCGMCLLWRTGKRAICICLSIPLLLFPLPYYVTHAEFRYRLVLDPLLTAVGAVTLDWLQTVRLSERVANLLAGTVKQTRVTKPYGDDNRFKGRVEGGSGIGWSGRCRSEQRSLQPTYRQF